jgi:hypothetical protein
MQDEIKTAGMVGLVGAALGMGVALGLGLRLFSGIAMVGLGTGVALGVLAGANPRRLSIPPSHALP